MLSLRVETMTGHYRVPGNVDTMGNAPTFPIAPPSTIRGFIESLCGKERGWFTGKVAYGWLVGESGDFGPVISGSLTRKAHVWSSSGRKGPGKTRYGQVVRPIRVHTMFDLHYRILIDADEEQERVIRAALRGEVDRYGVLSLGESDDVVSWMAEDPSDTPVKWVVGGLLMPLSVKSGQGYNTINPTIKTFDYGDEPEFIDFKEVA